VPLLRISADAAKREKCQARPLAIGAAFSDASIRTNSHIPLMRETVELLDGEF
jgi:hypothetical protein